jgi:hypothetical protein
MRIYLALALALAGCFDSGDDYTGAGGVGGGGGGGGTTGGGGGGGGGGNNTRDCPGSSLCSPSGPPAGLAFAGAEPLSGQWPNPAFVTTHNHILSGGTDEIQLQVANSNGELFLAPFTTTTWAPLVVEATDNGVVHLTETEGLAELDIVNPSDGLLYDTYNYASSPLATTTPLSEYELITSTDWFTDEADSFAFWPGTFDVVLAYQGPNGNRLVDTSLALAADGATQKRWDELTITNAAAGVHAVAITTGGGATATAQIRVVDRADTLAILVNEGGFTCVGAYSQAAFISHAPIAFAVDGTVATNNSGLGPNCIDAAAGTTVVATVAGATPLTYTAGAMPVHSAAEITARLAQLRAARSALQ